MITQALCTILKSGWMKGSYNLDAGGNTFNFALFKAAASIAGTYGATTTSYTQMVADEMTGTGYIAGGKPTANSGVTAPNTTARADFGNVQWAGLTATTRGAMMYAASLAGKDSIAIFDFGGDISFTNATLLLTMPAVGDTSSLIRIA